jgi:monoterpene epsilon-lactone hydrolase
MSWRAELLRRCLAQLKKRQRPARVPMAHVRLRLKRVERFIPHPPRGTQTSAVDANGVAAVRIVTRASRDDRWVLYFHGGGYTIGSAKLYRDFTWRVAAAARANVLFFDYRLAPECPFPAALDDAVSAYRWLANRIEPRRIAFMGDSAGGGLALATLHKLRDEGFALPAAAVALSPWTDLALTGASLTTNAAADPMLNVAILPTLVGYYLAGADPTHPYASPLYGDASGMPPILIHVGSDEILHDDAMRMAEKLRAAGREIEIEVWPRMPHAWHLYARLVPEGRHAIARIGSFLQARL